MNIPRLCLEKKKSHPTSLGKNNFCTTSRGLGEHHWPNVSETVAELVSNQSAIQITEHKSGAESNYPLLTIWGYGCVDYSNMPPDTKLTCWHRPSFSGLIVDVPCDLIKKNVIIHEQLASCLASQVQPQRRIYIFCLFAKHWPYGIYDGK